MKTYFGLLAEFEAGSVELEKVCGKYFGLDIREARRRALRHQLPVPVFRAVDSKRCQWLVSLEDLAAHLDAERAKAMEEYRAVNS